MGVVGHVETQVLLEARVPRLRQIARPQPPVDQLLLELEAQHDVQAVGRPRRPRPGSTTASSVHRAVQRVRRQRRRRAAESSARPRRQHIAERPPAPDHVLPQPALGLVQRQRLAVAERRALQRLGDARLVQPVPALVHRAVQRRGEVRLVPAGGDPNVAGCRSPVANGCTASSIRQAARSKPIRSSTSIDQLALPVDREVAVQDASRRPVGVLARPPRSAARSSDLSSSNRPRDLARASSRARSRRAPRRRRSRSRRSSRRSGARARSCAPGTGRTRRSPSWPGPRPTPAARPRRRAPGRRRARTGTRRAFSHRRLVTRTSAASSESGRCAVELRRPRPRAGARSRRRRTSRG